MSTQSCPISGFLIFALCLGLWGQGPWPGRFGASLPIRTWSGHASREGSSGCGAFLLARVPSGVIPRRWVAGPARECHSPEVFVLRAWKRNSLGRGRCALPALRALSAHAASPRSFARRREHVRAGERERPAPSAPRADFLRGLELGLGALESLGRRSARRFAAGLRGRASPGLSPVSLSYADPRFTPKSPGHIAAGSPPSRGQARGLGPGWGVGPGERPAQRSGRGGSR